MALQFGQRLSYSDKAQPKQGMWKTYRKYDGHSAIWIPSTGRMWSLGRSGAPKEIVVPAVIKRRLPQDMALHGELWHPSDKSSEVSKALIKNPTIDLWGSLKFIVFAFPRDIPFNPNVPATWVNIENDERWSDCREMVETNNFVILPEEVEPSSFDLSWEGLVHQRVDAQYRNRRVKTCLKWKPEYEDEATIVGWEDGKTGKRIGTTGAIIARWDMTEKWVGIHGGKSENVGYSYNVKISGLNEMEWDNAQDVYPRGNEIKFKFLAFTTAGRPQFCSIYRED